MRVPPIWFGPSLIFVLCYLQRLEGGLFNLQQTATIIAYAATNDPASYKHAELRLAQENASMEDVLTTLRDLLLTLQQEEDESDGSASGSGGGDSEGVDAVEKEVDKQYKACLVTWSAALARRVYSEA